MSGGEREGEEGWEGEWEERKEGGRWEHVGRKGGREVGACWDGEGGGSKLL